MRWWSTFELIMPAPNVMPAQLPHFPDPGVIRNLTDTQNRTHRKSLMGRKKDDLHRADVYGKRGSDSWSD